MTPEMPNAPLDTSLAFNMAPGEVQLPTAAPQQAAVLSAPVHDEEVKPTPPHIPLHDRHREADNKKQELQPNRDQVYHIRGTSTSAVQIFVQDFFPKCCPFKKKSLPWQLERYVLQRT